MHRQKNFKLVVFAGAFLSMNAGYINAIALLSMFHLAVSHVSGTVTRIGMAVLPWNENHFFEGLGLLVCFFLGAMISGLVIGHHQFKLGRRYGVVLMIQSLLLGVATYSLNHQLIQAVYLTSMACGLQNAMATSYSGAVIRSTHMTGVVTDLGLLIGHWLRDRKMEQWKLVLLGFLLLGFITGSFLGDACFHLMQNDALWLSSITSGIIGLIYFLYRQRNRIRRFLGLPELLDSTKE
ncbi:MAG: DUF1275 domain-containing protein [SAR324 cluster bacterium]|nr:DUF1275 domain-containing protein [SAR324 cluster bacterium]